MAARRRYKKWVVDGSTEENPVVSCKDGADWDNKLDENKNNDKLVVAYFSAEWCGPSRFIYPIVEDLAAKYKDQALFVNIDVDKLQATAEKERVDSIPSFVLFKNKGVVDRVVGARKEDLKAAVAKHVPET